MAHTIHEEWNEGWTVNKERRRGTDGNRGDLPKIRNTSRKLPQEGRDTSRTPPKISLGESSKKDNTDRERLVRPQHGRPIKESFDRSEEPQRERRFLPTHGHYVQEDLHLYGSPILHNDMILEATRITKWNNTKLANHTDMVKEVLTGKGQSARFTRGYGSFIMSPFVKGHQQCFN